MWPGQPCAAETRNWTNSLDIPFCKLFSKVVSIYKWLLSGGLLASEYSKPLCSSFSGFPPRIWSYSALRDLLLWGAVSRWPSNCKSTLQSQEWGSQSFDTLTETVTRSSQFLKLATNRIWAQNSKAGHVGNHLEFASVNCDWAPSYQTKGVFGNENFPPILSVLTAEICNRQLGRVWLTRCDVNCRACSSSINRTFIFLLLYIFLKVIAILYYLIVLHHVERLIRNSYVRFSCSQLSRAKVNKTQDRQ